jgi:hypothetical protein
MLRDRSAEGATKFGFTWGLIRQQYDLRDHATPAVKYNTDSRAVNDTLALISDCGARSPDTVADMSATQTANLPTQTAPETTPCLDKCANLPGVTAL